MANCISASTVRVVRLYYGERVSDKFDTVFPSDRDFYPDGFDVPAELWARYTMARQTWLDTLAELERLSDVR